MERIKWKRQGWVEDLRPARDDPGFGSGVLGLDAPHFSADRSCVSLFTRLRIPFSPTPFPFLIWTFNVSCPTRGASLPQCFQTSDNISSADLSSLLPAERERSSSREGPRRVFPSPSESVRAES